LTLSDGGTADEFRHEALLYAGEDELVAALLPFIVGGVRRNEPVMVAVSARKIELLKANLGWDAAWVDFVDMATLGTNPGRIISAWRRFVADHPDDPHLRGVGEPVWATRTPAELIECEVHELLLNAAFPPERAWRLVCPYDTSTLSDAVIEHAGHNHPVVIHDGSPGDSGAYRGDPVAFAAALEGALPELGEPWREVRFGEAERPEVRRLVLDAAAHLPVLRAEHLARSVDQVTENSVRHGGGRGSARVWAEAGTVVCEVRDGGRIRDPLVGRGLPPRQVADGRGLWLAHELCDLVQVRSSDQGTVVRLSITAA
jgi:hypothetical protein